MTRLVDEIVWVKQTINGKINKGHGYYLQHAKETCLVGYKGDLGDRIRGSIDCDVIFSMRRGQSQKPEEIYDICESLVPQGYYLEIFGRRNNLHDGWVTIGNELWAGRDLTRFYDNYFSENIQARLQSNISSC